MKNRLTPRQRLFANRCFMVWLYPTHTDAYLSVYKSKGTRKTATANASRIFNMPAVQDHIKALEEISNQQAVKDIQQGKEQYFRMRISG